MEITILNLFSLSSILLCILSFAFIFLLYFLLGKTLNIKLSNTYFEIGTSLALGLIFYSSGISIYKCGFFTQQFLLLFLVLILLYYGKNKKTIHFSSYSWGKILSCIIILSSAFAFTFLTSVYFDGEVFNFLFDDNYLYSKRAYEIYVNSKETTYLQNLEISPSHHYSHYIELWPVEPLSNMLNMNNYIFLIFIQRPIIISAILFFIIGYCKEFRLSKTKKVFAICILFLTSVPNFLNFENAPWYLIFNQRNLSLIHYFGAQPVLLYLIMGFTVYRYNSRSSGLIILSFTSIINPLFLVIVPLFLLSLMVFSKIEFLKKQKTTLRISNKIYLITIIISISCILHSVLIGMGKSETNSILSTINVNSLIVFLNILFRSLVCVSIYCFIYFLFLVKIKTFNSKEKEQILLLVIFLFSSIIIYSFFFDFFKGDLEQIIFIIWTVPIVFFGTLFLLKSISFTERYGKLWITLISINTIFGICNTFFEYNSSFGPVYNWNQPNYKKIQTNDLKLMDKLIPTIGLNGGYILNGNDKKTRGISVSDLAFLNSFNDEINTYRLNTVDFDENHFVAQKILKNTILNKFHNKEPNDRLQIIEAIKQLKIDWIYVNDIKYIFPKFLKNSYTKKYSFETFTIYTF